MLRQLAFPAFLAVILSNVFVRATPIEAFQNLEPRDNKWNLNCSNAPSVVAGNQVDHSESLLTPELQYSGSNQKWLKYLWCTVGTKTYTFFGMGEMNPAPGINPPGYRNLYQAFNQAAVKVSDIIAANGKDGPSGFWVSRPPNTNIEIGVTDAKGTKGTMTYGVLQSALSGLAQAAINYNPTNAPMLFQINDGKWGELGIGYAGYIDANDQCIYEITPNKWRGCTSVTNRWVID